MIVDRNEEHMEKINENENDNICLMRTRGCKRWKRKVDGGKSKERIEKEVDGKVDRNEELLSK